MYDFANSAFTTLVVTFIYSTYFTLTMAEDATTGAARWSFAITISAIAVALLSPYAGALADRGGHRKHLLVGTSLVCILGTALLFFPVPGQAWFALSAFIVANVAFELGYVFYNAYLPDIAPPDKIGRISGYGWALGYVGGLLCLAIALAGFVGVGGAPLFGISDENGLNVRATNLLVAGWFLVFSLPALFVLRNPPPVQPRAAGDVFRTATRELIRTFHSVRQYRHVFWFLLAHLIYNDGLVTVFALGGPYAASTFGFTVEDTIILGIALNVAAGLGAYLFGFMDDRWGGRTTVLVSIVGLSAFTLLAILAESRTIFWIAAVGIGLLVGPNQSASRSLMGRLTPPEKEGEFFGFYSFSGKATSFLGPLLFGVLTMLTGTQRLGLAALLVFFVTGGLLLLRVDETEGFRLARRVPDEPALLVKPEA